ncbi:hypothetical protein [Novosphingobium olei]|uniref:hypothetical protein n=1 Tax=Novosphingobium olei TaxID=2728851 RepID=UPI003090C40F|nr:hypothetical protein NSDW_35820 [Novosphingobium olei]
MPDLGAYERGLTALRTSSQFPDMAKALAAAIERETVVFGVRAGWVPEGRE